MASLPPASVPGAQFLEGIGGFGGFGADPVSLAMMGLKSGLALSKGDFIGAIPVLGGPINLMMSMFGGGPGKTTASKKAGQRALGDFEPQAQIYEAFGLSMGTPGTPETPRWKIWENRGAFRRGKPPLEVVDAQIRHALTLPLPNLIGKNNSDIIANELATLPPGTLAGNATDVVQYLKERTQLMGFDLRPIATNYPESFKVGGQNVSPEEYEILKKFFEDNPPGFNTSRHYLLDENGYPIVNTQTGQLETTESAPDFSALPEQLRGIATSITKDTADIDSRYTFQDFVQYVSPRTTYTLGGGTIGTPPPTEPPLASPAPVSQTPPPTVVPSPTPPPTEPTAQEKTSFLTEGLYNAVKNLMDEASKQGLAPIFRGGIGGDLMGFAPIPTEEKGIIGTRDFFSGLSQPQSAQQPELQGEADRYNKFQVEQLFPNASLQSAVSEEVKIKAEKESPNWPIFAMFGVGGGGLEIFKDILRGQKLPQERIQQIQEQASQVDEQIGALQSVFIPRQPQGKLKLPPEFAFPFIPYERFGFVPAMQRQGGF